MNGERERGSDVVPVEKGKVMGRTSHTCMKSMAGVIFTLQGFLLAVCISC
jgi:hypothetical protein